VDFTPPGLELMAITPYLAPGGAGLVVVRAGDAVQAETRVGPLAFPTFALGPPGTRVGLFALPHDYARSTALVINAQDEAGNTASRGIGAEVLPRRFRHDTVELSDAFLQAKVPELLPQRPPTQSLVDGFLTINRDQRRQAEEEKRRLAARTADRPLWEGAFLQPRNTKVFSNFAETRVYRYQGREIDTQVHFGYDLASTKQAPVPAANRGVVVFAGPLTIYGTTIVVDHGLGLMTLYSHLSGTRVKVGDQVDRGQEIGRTGTTGLATGDHLHYEVLVHGVSVTPLEWWDLKWIQDRIVGPLRAAGLTDVAGSRR
jgi:murein DD-endopeptidase MepM/ murein hydrolase activator NlpD